LAPFTYFARPFSAFVRFGWTVRPKIDSDFVTMFLESCHFIGVIVIPGSNRRSGFRPAESEPLSGATSLVSLPLHFITNVAVSISEKARAALEVLANVRERAKPKIALAFVNL